MAIQNLSELFMYDLGSMYSAEQMILLILPELANESDNAQAKEAYQAHEQETRQQAQNLEQCFQILGQQPPKVTCYAVAGLKQEHDTFLKERPSPAMLTAFDLGAAHKTEYFEMASYKGLIEKANLMGQPRVAQLLQQNYDQEQAMAQRVEGIARQLGQQLVQRTV
jgi:ferritin-like metal-binding protein YciE